jgi:hypothetical protein
MENAYGIEIDPIFDRTAGRKRSPNGGQPEMFNQWTINLGKLSEPNTHPMVSILLRFRWEPHGSAMTWTAIRQGNAHNSSHGQP